MFCASYGILLGLHERLLGLKVQISIVSPTEAPGCHHTMSVQRKRYNRTTLRLIHELQEEYSIRKVDAADTWINWKKRAGGSAEHRRQVEDIVEDIRENLHT